MQMPGESNQSKQIDGVELDNGVEKERERKRGIGRIIGEFY